MSSNNESTFICASIDFGTTYSGVAYSYRGDQDKVWTLSEWPDGNVASKIPTAILFDSTQNFVAFGNGAIEKYEELSEEDNEKEYYYFHRFKMNLYKKDLDRSLKLPDISGKEMSALKIFSEAIKYLHDHLISTLKKKGTDLEANAINWVLTVPAIWNDSAKQFMRNAAELAGIKSHNLVIALEPEAAAFYCLHTTERMVSTGNISNENIKYLVLDLGGGTLDIAAHRKRGKAKVKEIMRPSGGELGGTRVDLEFEKYMCRLFSQRNINNIKKEHPTAWIKAVQDFEAMKKKVNPDNRDDLLSLKIQKEIFDTRYFDQLSPQAREGAERKLTNLKFKKSVVAKMISGVSKQIASHMLKLLQTEDALKNLDVVIMVGGFSNSATVVEDVKQVALKNNISVIVPEQAELSVMKGAVLFGWKPQFIESRLCKKTYGFETLSEYNPKRHPERNKLQKNGKVYCQNVFVKLVEVDDEIEEGHFVEKKQSIIDTSKSSPINLFASDIKGVEYCDEPGVVRLGTVTLPPPKPGKDGTTSKQIIVKAYFGETEVRFEIEHPSTGETVEGKSDFL